jgi:1-acyl-sn-glycerol-3-phosphate acyltransferase
VTGAWGWIRGGRAVLFLLVFLLYLVFFMGLLQRLVIFPMAWLSPASAPRLFASWVRLQARITLRLLRVLGGVRVRVDGRIPPESCLVIMNHQSIIDIPIALSMMPGPLPLIPGRRRYARGIPGVSAYLRSAGNPLVSQKREHRKADLAGILAAANRVEAGEASLLIFPEGHRTRDGEILPFMPGGLQVTLSRTQRPVYCIVGDGMWKSRTVKDTFLNLATVRARARVLGPFHPPADKTEIPAFVDRVRSEMVATLAQMRQAERV